VLWLGIAATAAAFLALNRELREAGASQSPVHLLLVSLVAALLSYLLIDELVTSPQAIGGGLIVVGTLIANWRPLPSGG
jgi:drug/metabolite transporter (DMT)-like permease